MLDIQQLKKGDKFYIFDKDICFEHTIIECEVEKRFLKTKQYLLANTLAHIYPGVREDVTYENDESFPTEIYIESEEYMFSMDNFEQACSYRDEYVRLYELGLRACEGNIDGSDCYELGKYIESGYLEDVPLCFESYDIPIDGLSCQFCDWESKCYHKTFKD